MSVDWHSLTNSDIASEAAAYMDQYLPGDEGYCDPKACVWAMEEEFNLDVLMHLIGDKSDWIKWFKKEHADEVEDGRGWRCEEMLDRPINDPIIVLVRDGKGYLWDGWHRVGAAITLGMPTLKAFVGTPEPSPIAAPVP